jgi:hypothetical protein
LFHSQRVEESNLLFDTSFRRSAIAVSALSQLFVLALYALSIFNEPFAKRFLSWDLAFLYSLSVILSAIVYCWAIYLRSQAIEPLVLQSAITALVMAPVLWLASSVSVGSMLGGMLIVSLFSSVSVWRVYSVNRANLAGAH